MPKTKLSHVDLKNYIDNHHMYRGDLFKMYASIKLRFPFLDHERIAAAATIPPGLKRDLRACLVS